MKLSKPRSLNRPLYCLEQVKKTTKVFIIKAKRSHLNNFTWCGVKCGKRLNLSKVTPTMNLSKSGNIDTIYINARGKVDVKSMADLSQMTRAANYSSDKSSSKIPLYFKNSVTTMPQGKKVFWDNCTQVLH